MTDRADLLAQWLLHEGLQGGGQEELLEGYCRKLVEIGVPLARLHVAQRAYHPEFGGIGFDWLRDTGVTNENYPHTDTPSPQWFDSPMYHLLKTDLAEIRERLDAPGHVSRFPFLNELRDRGLTDYFSTGVLFEKGSVARPIDPDNTPAGMLISWCTDVPGGFSDTDIDLIRSLLPMLGLALKSASNRRMASDLLGVYLGRDAGARVLSGEIRRGSLQQINAVICYFDLTGFTSLTERTAGDAIIAMLNDYFAIVVGQIQQAGGHVLKFMGDGLLAMFDQPDTAQAARAALDVAATLRGRMDQANRDRAGRGLPTTGFTLALHAGELLYGNIGAEDRLDFTAIGPAMNLTARLSGMHKPLEQELILSEPVARAAQGAGHDIVPLGRYMLRGVSEPQALYTVHRGG